MKRELTKENIIQYYITELHSTEQCLKFFQCSRWAFQKALSNYAIKKTREQKKKTAEKTCMDRYGTINASATEAAKEKRKRTCLEKYGVENPGSLVETKEKRKKTCLEKYGEESYSKTKEWHRQVEKTSISKYGVSSPNQVEEKKKKTKDTLQKRYGVKAPIAITEIKEKAEKTKQERYGDPHYVNKEKIRKTCIDLYGENYGKIFAEKARKTCEKKYGTPFAWQKNIDHYEIWENKQKFVDYLKSSVIDGKKPFLYQVANFFHVDDSAVCQKLTQYNIEGMIDRLEKRSHYEEEIIDYLHSLGVSSIEKNNKTLLDGKEIDIYMPEYRIGIEFNGNYWHSDMMKKFQDHGGRSTYHQEKSLLAEKKGIFLFHIFEYEWNDEKIQSQIKSRLSAILKKNSIFIPARKCEVILLSKAQKKTFLDENHIQGNDHSSIQLGLLFKKEIVACMTFIRPKTQYTWELSRFCSKKGVSVQGGASKIFTYFVKNFLKEKETVVSYNDITKTKGEIYKTLGFALKSINSPNYVWINFLTKDIRTRYQEQAAGESRRMHDKGYCRICDCGTKTWIYTKE